MSTIRLSCGCSFSHSMYGDREMMGFHICEHHISLVQDCKVSELQKFVMENPINDDNVA